MKLEKSVIGLLFVILFALVSVSVAQKTPDSKKGKTKTILPSKTVKIEKPKTSIPLRREITIKNDGSIEIQVGNIVISFNKVSGAKFGHKSGGASNLMLDLHPKLGFKFIL